MESFVRHIQFASKAGSTKQVVTWVTQHLPGKLSSASAGTEMKTIYDRRQNGKINKSATCAPTRLPKIIFMTLTNQRQGCFVDPLSTAASSNTVASSGLYPWLPQDSDVTPRRPSGDLVRYSFKLSDSANFQQLR